MKYSRVVAAEIAQHVESQITAVQPSAYTSRPQSTFVDLSELKERDDIASDATSIAQEVYRILCTRLRVHGLVMLSKDDRSAYALLEDVLLGVADAQAAATEFCYQTQEGWLNDVGGFTT